MILGYCIICLHHGNISTKRKLCFDVGEIFGEYFRGQRDSLKAQIRPFQGETVFNIIKADKLY